MEDNSRISDEEYLLKVLKGSSKKGEEEFDFGEEMIHSLIESIEFVLGTVSHVGFTGILATASRRFSSPSDGF